MEMTLRTFSVLVDDEPGVLSQISRLFSRKGFNIESLAVGPTEERGLSLIHILPGGRGEALHRLLRL